MIAIPHTCAGHRIADPARPRASQGRGRVVQLLRVLIVASVLAARRYPATAEEIREDVCERMGEPWCVRSIVRDLGALELAGFAESIPVPHGGRGRRAATKWVSVGSHPLVNRPAVLMRLREASRVEV